MAVELIVAHTRLAPLRTVPMVLALSAVRMHQTRTSRTSSPIIIGALRP